MSGFACGPDVRAGGSLSGQLPEITTGCCRPRLCENTELRGFRMSLYPSRAVAKPVQRDLNGRLFRLERSAYVFTQPRPVPAVRLGAHENTQRSV